jgi:hypothetical protein
MKKFNNYIDFAIHVKVLKYNKIEKSLELLKTGIFVDDLSHLTSEQLNEMIPNDKSEHLDYILNNRKDIIYHDCLFEKSVSWNTNYDTFSLIYKILIPNTGEIVEVKKSLFLTNNDGLPSDIEFIIEDIYLKESFIESNTIKDYNDEDLSLIKLYNTLINNKGPVDYVTKHVLRKTTKIIVSDIPKLYVSYSLLTRQIINAGFSKYFMRISDTSSKSFAEKLRNLLETEYTLPMVAKKIDELTEDDITVIQMGLI